MENLIILFETDLHSSKSSRVFLGVFDSEEAAIYAAKENNCYDTNRGVQPEYVECELNKFEEL